MFEKILVFMYRGALGRNIPLPVSMHSVQCAGLAPRLHDCGLLRHALSIAQTGMTENFRCLRGLCLDFSLPVLKEVEADPESAAATERHFPSDIAWAESCVCY